MSTVNLRVLLVEDNPTDVLVVRDELSAGANATFAVTHVERLAEALEQLKNQVFEVVLLDLSLPDSSGLETFERISAAAPQVPIVVLSGRSDEAFATKAVQAGAQDYLVKGHLDDRVLPRAITHAVERKRSAAAIADGERKFRQVVQALPAAVYACDASGHITLFNQAAVDLWGREPDIEHDLWCGSYKILDAGGLNVPFEGCPMAVTIKHGLAVDGGEVVVQRSNGSRRFVVPHPVPLFDAAGAVVGGVNMLVDITEQKRSETERERFFSLSPDLLCVMGVDGYFKRLNPSFERTLGYTEAELCAVPGIEFLHPDDQAAASTEITRIQNGVVTPIIENRYRCKNGSYRWLSWTATPFLEDGTIYCAGRDITDRKRMEAALQESHALYHNLVDEMPAGVMRKDAAGRYVFVNAWFCKLTGVTPADCIGRSGTEVAATILPRGDTRIVGGDIATPFTDGDRSHEQIMRTGERLEVEEEWTGADGRKIQMQAVRTPVRDLAGTIMGSQGVLFDITERKTLEEQALRAQRLESVGMLAAGITHDLNNVLAPIGMAASILRDHLSESRDLRMLDTLQSCADRGAALVRQILGFAHGVSGEPTLVQVKHLLNDISAMMTATFPKSINLRDEVPNDLWPVLANPTQIHQVLLNLCVNARDAMPNGGTLTLRAENCVLDAETACYMEGARAGAWLVLHVEDTGGGISPAIAAHIWEPFFSTKAASHGTGLGLSTVRGIVATRGGFVMMGTEVGRGTTFRVYLPAELEKASGTRSPLPQTTDQGHGELILLVDDEELIRQTATIILTEAGYEVLTAQDGLEAASVFTGRAAEVVLVITDLDMPHVNGATLIHRLKNLKPGVKTLAMSGISSGFTKQRHAEFASAFMQKPFTAHALLGHIHRLLHDTAA